MFLFRLAVRGHSMEPTIKDKSYVIASDLPFILGKPKVRDIVVFKKENKFIIKRIKKVKDGKYEMAGDNEGDSRDFGLISRDEIVGKVIKR